MFLRKKKPKRLYYPAKSKWYARPRRRPSVKRTKKIFKKGIGGWLKDLAKKSLFLAITAIALVALIVFLSFSSYFSIMNIEVVRENFNVDSAAIENQLNEFIGKNLLFLSKSRIHQTIQIHFPEFASIEVHKILPSTIQINLESHPVVANLRAYYILPETEEILSDDFTELTRAIEELYDSDPSLINPPPSPLYDEGVVDSIFNLEEGADEPEPIEQKCLINRIGQAIFDQEENLSLMTITVHGLTQPVEDRELAIPSKHMDYILEMIQHFTNVIGLEVLGLEYLPTAREIRLKTVNNLVIWISIERDYKKQIEKLSTIYEAAELNKEDLSYIDLRVRNKVIYCSRGARCDQ